MTQAILVGMYTLESKFEEELNKVISKFDYNNMEIQYKVCISDITGETLFSALVIIKDCR